VDVPGPAVTQLGQTARTNNLYLVMGVVERDAGTLYCSVLFFAPDGTFLGKHPQGHAEMPVFDTPLGRLGAVICWENYLPLKRAAMYAKGVQIYCAPTTRGLPRCDISLSKAVVSFCPAISSIGVVTFPWITPQLSATIPKPS
jgi:nitrilase